MIVDLHADVLADVESRRRRGEKAVLLRRYRPRWCQASVYAALAPVGGDTSLHPTDLAGTLELLDWVEDEVNESNGWLVVARNPDGIRTAIRNDQFVLILTLEGGRPLEGALSNFDLLHRRGVSFLGLTHNRRNELGCGVAEHGNNLGLTAFGLEVVRHAGELGVGLDVSHLSECGYWQVLEHSRSFVIASHSCARAICNHVRNLSDEQLKALVEVHGVIGVTFVGSFLSDARYPALADVLRHIGHIGKLVGYSRIGIGSDFVDYEPGRLEKSREATAIDPNRWPAFPEPLTSIEGLGSLGGILKDAGYDEPTIGGILGENFLSSWAMKFSK